MFTQTLPLPENLVPLALHRWTSVGGICLRSSCVSADTHLKQFACEQRTHDISIVSFSCKNIVSKTGDPAFNSGAVWSLYRDGGDFAFDFVNPRLSPSPYKRLRLTGDFRCAEIAMNASALGEHSSVSPLEYPADELLITNYLAFHGIGAEMHGCGFVDREAGGQLFLGHSGAGKSTTMRVWEYFRSPEILSDDRIILRIHDGELWMYGTPWHGEAEFASPGRSRLSRIFILQHGRENSIEPLSKAQALGEMFARCFPPFYSHVGIERTLEFLKRALETVPVYRFEFVPDETSVEAVLSFHG